MIFKVTFESGKKEYAATQKEAVRIVKVRWKAVMQRDDRILWTKQYPAGMLLCAAFIIHSSGNSIGAALIEEEQ